jgi:siroheme synthase (precorrin-2 oxidase/ferrochelatase)
MQPVCIEKPVENHIQSNVLYEFTDRRPQIRQTPNKRIDLQGEYMKNIALIGCGRISKRHKEAIAATEGVEITWVCDSSKERAKALAEELQCDYVTDYRELSRKGIDVAAILTPSGLHPLHAAEVAEVHRHPLHPNREAHQPYPKRSLRGFS